MMICIIRGVPGIGLGKTVGLGQEQNNTAIPKYTSVGALQSTTATRQVEF